MDNKKTSLGGRLASSEAFVSVAASLICIVIGLLLGVIVLAIIDAEHAIGDGLLVILQSGIKSPRNMGTVLANAAPLIMTGLSVGFAFKTGLFNIGAAGQYTLGAFGALYCAIVLQLPWYLCLLAAMVLGAIWGAIPGFFKAYMNINEVITSIMFNWIGLYMVNDIMYGKGQSPMYDLATTKTYSLRKAAQSAMIPSCGMSDYFGKLQSVTIAIFIAIFFALIVYVVLNKTTFGYELKACGFNKNAAQYAGINDKRNIILSMTIAGALAGVGAGLYYLSTVAEWNPQVSTALPAIGFNGISAALLACSNPIGTIFSSLFISYIT
ncbi:MAG: ABC transporter permease, partial [Candidatus Ventricola sp.]